MLSNALDTPALAATLKAQGRCQIPSFLQEDAAARLHRCLAEDVPWALSVHGDEGFRPLTHAVYAALGPGERAALTRATATSGRGRGFRFVFENYEMIQNYKAGRDRGLLLHRVLEFLNSPPFLAWARALTGNDALRRVSAQATCFRPGHFLRAHNDSDAREGRRFAYVLNLTRRWAADWGGQLQFLDEGAYPHVIRSFLPRWNSLSVFAVPFPHCVNEVAPWAEEPRFSITGWFLV